MKKICVSFLVLVSFLCCSCLELTEVITIRRDGGMTVTMTYSLPAAQVPAIAAGQKTISQWQKGRGRVEQNYDANWFMDEKAVRGFFDNPGDGVSVRFYKQFLRDGRHFAEIVIDAKDGKKAAGLGYFGPMVLEDTTMTLYMEETLNDLKADDVQRMRKLCGDMMLVIEVITPGAVEKTTGYKRSGTHVVWRYSADGRGIDIFGKLEDLSVSWK